MKKILMTLFMAGLLLTSVFAETATDSPKTAIDKLVKNINLPADDFSSLALDMHMNLPEPANLKILAQLRCVDDDQYALFVFDRFDNTPILIVTEQTAMINDPLADGVTLIASAGVTFELGPQGEQYNAYFSFTMPDGKDILNKVDLDFTTLFSRVTHDTTASHTADGLLEFKGKTERKSSCYAVFAPDRPFALQSVALGLEEGKEPILEFPMIRVEQKIASSVFLFPLDALDSSGVKVNRVSPEGMIDKMVIMTQIMRALFVRLAIRSEDLRNEIQKNFGLAPDWEKLEKNNAKRSVRLKKIFKPLGFSHQGTGTQR